MNSDIDIEMVELLTDNYFQAGQREILNALSFFANNQGIYSYLYNYTGAVRNAEELWNISRIDIGPCCGDELNYLFFNDDIERLLTEDDKIFR